jgi:site-specific recombinase XerD
MTGDVLAVQQLLGHADLSTTAAYLKPLEPERMREIIEQLDTRWTH